MVALPGRIVIDLPNWLGDLIHTIPAVQRLMAANRAGESWALAPPQHAPLVKALGLRPIARPPRAGYRWARHTLDRRYDATLSARHSTRAKLLLAGIAADLRLASRGRGAETLGLVAFDVDRERHQRHDLDGALTRLGAGAVEGGVSRLSLSSRLRQKGLAQRFLLAGRSPVVALLPGTRHCPPKRYPLPSLAWLARELERAGVVVLVFVGPGEEHVAAEVAAGGRARVAPTTWPLDEIAGLLWACDAAIGNDAGLTHLAAVAGCPTVALFGPTDPARTAPVGGSLILQPLRSGRMEPGRDLALLPPDAILQSVFSLLAAPQGLRNLASDDMIAIGGGPLAQLAEQGTLNP